MSKLQYYSAYLRLCNSALKNNESSQKAKPAGGQEDAGRGEIDRDALKML